MVSLFGRAFKAGKSYVKKKIALELKVKKAYETQLLKERLKEAKIRAKLKFVKKTNKPFRDRIPSLT